MEIKKLMNIKGRSQEFTQAPQLIRKGKNMILKYDYESETGEYKWAGITFIDVVTCKITKKMCEELYMIEAYDSISIIKESKWLNDVKTNYKGTDLFMLGHYIIYFEDYGCYEFIAKEAHNEIIDN